MKWEVKHSESKNAFNIIGTELGGKYKIARIPYFVAKYSEEVSEREKLEAEQHAKLIACAPEMFEKLKETLDVLKWYMNNTYPDDDKHEDFFNIGMNDITQIEQLIQKAVEQ